LLTPRPDGDFASWPLGPALSPLSHRAGPRRLQFRCPARADQGALRTAPRRNFPVDYHLEQLEELLDPSQFFRINRKFIVNYAAIEQMHTYSKSRVKLLLKPPADQETVVSADRSPHFKEWLLGKGGA
jgi:hypothetical protein